jgi:putative ABC transport system substrate-binding protein
MNEKASLRILNSCYDNLKSKIQNLKWLGLSVIAFVLVVTGAVADAQQAGKIFRIGFLDGGTAAGSAGLLEAFWQEMRKLGWIEGNNITIEYRFSEGKRERRPELAADLVRLKVDLILVTRGR